MPLTDFQRELLAALARARTDDRYLAGGAALHFAPNSARYSDDLDFFHDSAERVAASFDADRRLLEGEGYTLAIQVSQPGFIRAIVSRGRAADAATRVDWAHDSAWRFMPLVRESGGALLLHPVDLAINKTLALAGRDEARDFVDILFVHANTLPLGALTWAAAGKDPGFTPRSLLELLKRRGRYQPQDFARLQLAEPFDLVRAKETWLAALEAAEGFAAIAPATDAGCLYWCRTRTAFVLPTRDEIAEGTVSPHFGRPGGVLPRIADQPA